jgi:hypothetical protein
MNLIVSGLEEGVQNSDPTVANEEQNQQDAVAIESIFSAEFDIKNTVFETERVGSKVQCNERMVRIKFKNAKDRKDVLAKAKDLRESENEAHKNVYIRPDMTKKQRERSKNLKEELSRRREENPGKRFIIRRYEVVEI